MLVLTRKVGETLCIGDNIQIHLSKLVGSRVFLAIQAPKEVSIKRGETIIESTSSEGGGEPVA